MIDIDIISDAARQLMDKAAIEIPDDYLAGLKQVAAKEEGELSSIVLQTLLETFRNSEIQ